VELRDRGVLLEVGLRIRVSRASCVLASMGAP